MSKILFLPRQNKIHIFKPLLLYRQRDIDKIIKGNYRNYVIDKLTREIMEINHSGPGCSFYEFYEWYRYSPVKH